MRHIKYFLTGLLFLTIALAIICGLYAIGYLMVSFVAAHLSAATIAITQNILVLVFFLIIGIIFIAMLHTLGHDYWRQRHLDRVQADYEKWRAEYYTSLEEDK